MVILGIGGIGKTTLSTAALHHSDIVAKFTLRYFVPCESTSSSSDLISLTASHLGLDRSGKLVDAILKRFSAGPPCLLVFDNFESPWEPATSRVQVEEYLSLLTDIPHLAVMVSASPDTQTRLTTRQVTMRGAERPGKVRWTRPFLQPLKPLADSAARNTFFDIADDTAYEEEQYIEELLNLTGNLPLAITLVANLAAFEGCKTVISRWKHENTALLSEGDNKSSNLEKSIVVSLSSPRMTSSPNALELLSLLSLLPDGIADRELEQSALPIPDIPKCKTTLLRTSLAYIDYDSRLKVLAPVREYIRTTHRPSASLARPLRRHFHELLSLWETYQELPSGDLVPRLAANLGNLHGLLVHGLEEEGPDLRDTAYSILALNYFSELTARGSSDLMQFIVGLVERTGDDRLHGHYLWSIVHHQNPSDVDLEELSKKGVQCFKNANDRSGEGTSILFSIPA